MKIIGFAGKKRSGKDTAFDALKGMDAKRYAFADMLKEACKMLFGLTEEQAYGDKRETLTEILWENIPENIKDKYSIGKDKIHMNAREILQIFGTEVCRRMFDDEIWINATFRQIKKDKPELAVITDVRFPNEANAILEKNGGIFKVIRPSQTSGDGHESETALDNYHEWDAILVNDGSIECFEGKVKKTVSQWLEKGMIVSPD